MIGLCHLRIRVKGSVSAQGSEDMKAGKISRP
jgi:hypothetical protein